MDRLTWMLARMLRDAARLLPSARREWAEAVRAEADLVPAGWPRVGWLAGGLWLAVKEAEVMRKVVYWLGIGAVAAAAGWAVWLSWHTSPAADALTVTDRVRVLVGVAALALLPWMGRRHGWFGPVGNSITARLVRVAGCVAACGLGAAIVRMDSQIHGGPHGPGPFSLSREIAAAVILAAGLAALRVVRARWPQVDAYALWLSAGMTGVIVLVLLPAQGIAALYVAAILAATSRRSLVASGSLAAGAMTGLPAGLAQALAIYGLNTPDDRYVSLLIVLMTAITFLFAVPAGVAAAWLRSGNEDPAELREARIRQGLLAGSVSGAAAGLVLTDFVPIAVFMMVLGPLLGAAGGALGGAVAAYHPRKPRPARSWAAGLFVRSGS
jgi:hypothetical protein